MYVHRTTILLPEDLRSSAEAQARREGISLGELIRRQLRAVTVSSKAGNRRNDPVFRYHTSNNFEPAEDTAEDVSINHDKYLAEALEAEIRRWR